MEQKEKYYHILVIPFRSVGESALAARNMQRAVSFPQTKIKLKTDSGFTVAEIPM